MTILCTVGMVADIVRGVAGDVVKVDVMMGSGVDPHLYKPSSSDVKNIAAADGILYSGLYLEGKLEGTFLAMQKQGKRVVALSEAIPRELLLANEDNPEHPDPHVWMDVSLWRRVTETARDVLTEWMPEHQAEFAANAEGMMAELQELDTYVERAIASVPESRRVLITAHDAFRYFGRRYGIEVMGIQGISTESEAGIRHLNNLVDLIVERKIQAVFVETTVTAKNVKALIEGAASRGHELKIGGNLFSDAMGASGTYEGTYPGMLDHNATVIARALGGTAPETGLAGRLGSADHE